MERETYKLSICLPTYNQLGALKDLLESLVIQYDPQIEIVVRDDSTGTDTRSLIAEFQKKMPIRYFHGEREGLDSAVIFLTEEARGVFIWWIGDDVIAPGAIQRILTVINGNPDLTFIWANSSDITNSKALTVSDTQSRFYIDRNEPVKMGIGLLGFITATLIKREIALACLGSARKHIGSAFVCLYIVLYVLSQQGKYYFLGAPCFYSKPKPSGEVRWYDQFQVFGINLFKIVMEFNDRFDRRQIRKALSRNLALVVKAVIVERALGLNTGFASSSPKVAPLARLYWSYWVFWAALPMLLVPRKVLSKIYGLYKKLGFSRNRASVSGPF